MSQVFVHLPTVGYSEAANYAVRDPLTTRWNSLRGIKHAKMDVVIYYPYEEHRHARTFTQESLFSSFIRCRIDVRPC